MGGAVIRKSPHLKKQNRSHGSKGCISGSENHFPEARFRPRFRIREADLLTGMIQACRQPHHSFAQKNPIPNVGNMSKFEPSTKSRKQGG